MKRPAAITLLAIGVGAAAAPPTAEAQIWKKAKESLEQAAKGARSAEEITTLLRNAARCVFTDEQCIGKAKAGGKPVVLTDAAGTVLKDEAGQPVTDPAQLPPEQRAQLGQKPPAGQQGVQAGAPGAQEPTRVSLPPVENGRFIATASPWTRDDGSGAMERAEFSGRAVATASRGHGGHTTYTITLARCEDVPDVPKQLSLGPVGGGASGTAGDSAATFRDPRGEVLWMAQEPDGYTGKPRAVARAVTLQQHTGWLELEPFSAGVLTGTARITWRNPWSTRGAYTAADGKIRPVVFEARFRAVTRPANDHTPICPPGEAGKPAAPAKASPAPAKPAAPAAPMEFTTSYKPKYPFGLQNLLAAIEGLPPSDQQLIRSAYQQLTYGTLAKYYDAGCGAQAFWDVWRQQPQPQPLENVLNAVSFHECIDHTKIAKTWAQNAMSEKGDAVHYGSPSVRPAWLKASEEQRSRFATCLGQDVADYWTGILTKPPVNYRYAEDVFALKQLPPMSDACASRFLR